MNDDLNTITNRFSRIYDRANKAKQSLAERQKELFEAFTQELEKRPLARKTVPCPFWGEMTMKEQETWLKTHYPGWRFAGEDRPSVIIEEDPALRKFTYVNPNTKLVYGRTTVEGSPNLDDEALREKDPELWERVTDWPDPWYSMVKDLVTQYTSLSWNQKALDGTIGKHLSKYGLQRVLKDFNKLSNEDMMDLQDYLIPGQVSVRLVPPREAKPEELEHVQEEA